MWHRLFTEGSIGTHHDGGRGGISRVLTFSLLVNGALLVLARLQRVVPIHFAIELPSTRLRGFWYAGQIAD